MCACVFNLVTPPAPRLLLSQDPVWRALSFRRAHMRAGQGESGTHGSDTASIAGASESNTPPAAPHVTQATVVEGAHEPHAASEGRQTPPLIASPAATMVADVGPAFLRREIGEPVAIPLQRTVHFAAARSGSPAAAADDDRTQAVVLSDTQLGKDQTQAIFLRDSQLGPADDDGDAPPTQPDGGLPKFLAREVGRASTEPFLLEPTLPLHDSEHDALGPTLPLHADEPDEGKPSQPGVWRAQSNVAHARSERGASRGANRDGARRSSRAVELMARRTCGASCGTRTIPTAPTRRSRTRTRQTTRCRRTLSHRSVPGWSSARRNRSARRTRLAQRASDARSRRVQLSQESVRSVHFRRAPDSIIPRSEATATESARSSPLLGNDSQPAEHEHEPVPAVAEVRPAPRKVRSAPPAPPELIRRAAASIHCAASRSTNHGAADRGRAPRRGAATGPADQRSVAGAHRPSVSACRLPQG